MNNSRKVGKLGKKSRDRKDDEVNMQGVEPEYLRPSEIAQSMGVTKRTVLNMYYRGELEGMKFGFQVRIRKSSYDAYREAHRRQSGDVSSLEKGSDSVH